MFVYLSIHLSFMYVLIKKNAIVIILIVSHAVLKILLKKIVSFVSLLVLKILLLSILQVMFDFQINKNHIKKHCK